VRLALKVAMQNDGGFMDVILAHSEAQSWKEFHALTNSQIYLPQKRTTKFNRILSCNFGIKI